MSCVSSRPFYSEDSLVRFLSIAVQYHCDHYALRAVSCSNHGSPRHRCLAGRASIHHQHSVKPRTLYHLHFIPKARYLPRRHLMMISANDLGNISGQLATLSRASDLCCQCGARLEDDCGLRAKKLSRCGRLAQGSISIPVPQRTGRKNPMGLGREYAEILSLICSKFSLRIF